MIAYHQRQLGEQYLASKNARVAMINRLKDLLEPRRDQTRTKRRGARTRKRTSLTTKAKIVAAEVGLHLLVHVIPSGDYIIHSTVTSSSRSSKEKWPGQIIMRTLRHQSFGLLSIVVFKVLLVPGSLHYLVDSTHPSPTLSPASRGRTHVSLRG